MFKLQLVSIYGNRLYVLLSAACMVFKLKVKYCRHEQLPNVKSTQQISLSCSRLSPTVVLLVQIAPLSSSFPISSSLDGYIGARQKEQSMISCNCCPFLFYRIYSCSCTYIQLDTNKRLHQTKFDSPCASLIEIDHDRFICGLGTYQTTCCDNIFQQCDAP